MEPTVTRNKVVYLTYTILDQTGNLFEKIEQSLEGKSVGDRVEVILTPADGGGQSPRMH